MMRFSVQLMVRSICFYTSQCILGSADVSKNNNLACVIKLNLSFFEVAEHQSTVLVMGNLPANTEIFTFIWTASDSKLVHFWLPQSHSDKTLSERSF